MNENGNRFRTAAAALALVVATSIHAQAPPRPIPVGLELISSTKVPFVTAPGIVAPLRCTSDNSVLLLPVSSDGIGDAVLIASDGQQTTRFGREKIQDVPGASPQASFTLGSDIYFLLRSYAAPRTVTLKIPKADGSVESRQTQLPSERRFYIARFTQNGDYQSSVRLDVSFLPRQFGVFPSGGFLVAGRMADPAAGPRIALFGSNGQLIHLLELPNDIGKETPELNQPDASPVIPAMGSLQAALDLSAIVADGPNLLLVRKGPHGPIFSVTAGGAVREVKLKLPEKGALYSIHSTRDGLLAQYVRRVDEARGIAFETYLFDRDTGEPVHAYAYPQTLGFGLACSDGIGFSFIKRENDNTVALVRAMSTLRKSSTKDPTALPPPK